MTPELPSDVDPVAESSIDHTDVIAICKLLIGAYAEAYDLTTDQLAETITIEKLVAFAQENDILQRHRGEVLAADIPADTLAFVATALQNPYQACQLLFPIWRMIISPSPPVSVPPLLMDATVTIVFVDDRVLQMKAVTPWKVDEPVTNGFVSAMLQQQFFVLLNTISSQGLDKLRREAAQTVSGSVETICRNNGWPIPSKPLITPDGI